MSLLGLRSSDCSNSTSLTIAGCCVVVVDVDVELGYRFFGPSEDVPPNCCVNCGRSCGEMGRPNRVDNNCRSLFTFSISCLPRSISVFERAGFTEGGSILILFGWSTLFVDVCSSDGNLFELVLFPVRFMAS